MSKRGKAEIRQLVKDEVGRRIAEAGQTLGQATGLHIRETIRPIEDRLADLEKSMTELSSQPRRRRKPKDTESND